MLWAGGGVGTQSEQANMARQQENTAAEELALVVPAPAAAVTYDMVVAAAAVTAEDVAQFLELPPPDLSDDEDAEAWGLMASSDEECVSDVDTDCSYSTNDGEGMGEANDWDSWWVRVG